MKNTHPIWTNVGWFTKHKKPGVESRLNESPVQIEGRKVPSLPAEKRECLSLLSEGRRRRRRTGTRGI